VRHAILGVAFCCRYSKVWLPRSSAAAEITQCLQKSGIKPDGRANFKIGYFEIASYKKLILKN
jgi:hypothetical protein